MGKNRRGIKELAKEQRLSKENSELKRELSHLRKQIARLDVDRFETMKQMCRDYQENERFQENLEPVSSNMDALKREWACNKCVEGWLEINLYPKLGQTWYYRSCGCGNRTKGQRYDAESVKGILKK